MGTTNSGRVWQHRRKAQKISIMPAMGSSISYWIQEKAIGHHVVNTSPGLAHRDAVPHRKLDSRRGWAGRSRTDPAHYQALRSGPIATAGKKEATEN